MSSQLVIPIAGHGCACHRECALVLDGRHKNLSLADCSRMWTSELQLTYPRPQAPRSFPMHVRERKRLGSLGRGYISRHSVLIVFFTIGSSNCYHINILLSYDRFSNCL